MQIQSSPQGAAETIRDVSGRLLSMLVEGQNVQATVIAKLAPDLVKIKIADTLLQLKTDQSLQVGQQISLQKTQQAGETVVKIQASSLPVNEPPNLLSLLKPGQQVAVEVIKLLANNNVLVKPILLTRPEQAQTSYNTAIAEQKSVSNQPGVSTKLPAPSIEVDVRALKQTFSAGDKLTMQVITTQPLAIHLKNNVPTRAEQIQHYQQITLPQVHKSNTVFESINQVLPRLTQQMPAIQQAFSQMMNHVSEKSALQDAQQLKQSLLNSGIFLESKLKSGTAEPIQQDFKGNLLQVARDIQQQINQSQPLRLDTNSKVFQSLPREIQQALRQVINSPAALQTLPAQIQSFLASQGQSPAVLLRSLLVALQPSSTQAGQISTELEAPTASANRVINNAANTEQTLQAQTRFNEWQMLRDVMREVSSVHSRIQLNQLAMLKDPDNPSPANVWLFDLPVKERQQLELMQLRIEQHQGRQAGKEDEIWQVQLNLETLNLGPMQAHISLLQNDVKVVVLAERVQSAQLLAEHVDELNQRLQELGVSVSHLSCRQAPLSDKPILAGIGPEVSNMVDISV